MSLDKAIASGKEKRKPYTKSKALDASCRNGGSCPWCAKGRKHKDKKHVCNLDGWWTCVDYEDDEK